MNANTQTLINQYTQAVLDKETAEKQKKDAAIARAQEHFEANCRVWLAAIWDELTIGEVKQYARENNWQRLEIDFRWSLQVFDVQGTLEQRVEEYQDGGLRWGAPKLDFGYLQFSEKETKYLYIQLDSDDKAGAIAPKMETLGYVLANLARYAPIHQQQQERHRQMEINNLLDFSHMTRQGIAGQLERALKEYPELADQFKANAAKALAEHDEEERQRQEENRLHLAINAEREVLRTKAAAAWNKPFTIYLVTYGAFTDTDGEVITRSFWSFEDHAHRDDGYWLALDGGELKRKIRPSHVLSVEEVVITKESEAPYEAKRYLDIESERFEDVSISAYLPPLEVMGFIAEA